MEPTCGEVPFDTHAIDMPLSAVANPVVNPNRAGAALSLIAALAIALPFLACFTRPPSTNFWPLAASWLCTAVLLLVSAARGLSGPSWSVLHLARLTAAGLFAAALVSSCIGLTQYFGLRGALLPWVYDAPVGQAMGNLRQRNQQATLLSIGVWALVWWVARRRTGPLFAAPVAGNGLAFERWRTVASWAAMALLAIGSAATASRTGLIQWLLMLALAFLWRKRMAAGAGRLLVGGLGVYAVASWALPALLWQGLGVRGSGVFERVTASYGCGSRRVLWSNVLDLIALRPWAGWGWGELDYAHYVTLFPGERFCTLLDNAHNLPLHLAVELGVPVALLLCGGAALLTLHARPWAETQAPRQLAWGVLLPIGLHSLLEFPLWYGPFQLAALAALTLLAGRHCVQYFKRKWPFAQFVKALIAIFLIVIVALLGVQYSALSQLYLPVASRSQTLTVQADGRLAQAPLWSDAARFARLTTMKVNADNAVEVYALALDLLHYSPEPRVIERLIDSAKLLGQKSEANFHQARYAAAYPADYAKWLSVAKASAAAD